MASKLDGDYSPSKFSLAGTILGGIEHVYPLVHVASSPKPVSSPLKLVLKKYY